MKKLIRKFIPKTTWCKVNLALTVVMVLGFAALPFVQSYMSSGVPVCPSNTNGQICFFPNPYDCTKYYECYDGILSPMQCPDYLYYCSEKQYCTWTWDPDCKFDCVGTRSGSPADADMNAVNPISLRSLGSGCGSPPVTCFTKYTWDREKGVVITTCPDNSGTSQCSSAIAKKGSESGQSECYLY